MSGEPVDVKELFTYENKIKSQTNTDVAGEVQKSEFVKHRIFLNQVDSYNAKYIASFITDKLCGGSKQAGGEFGEGEEGGEELGEEDAFNKPFPDTSPPVKYEVVGTSKRGKPPSEDVTAILDETNEEQLESDVLKCGFVVYDITHDRDEIPKALKTLSAIIKEIERVSEIGPKTFKAYTDVRVFILISSVVTWAASKPIDRDDPTIPFSETDYKKRRPHPSYTDYIECEREVTLKGRKYPDKLKTYVVCSGITYGQEQEDLTFIFKLAWKNEVYLPVFNPGTNYVPLIHVDDLAKVIHGICENKPSRPKYILAVEQTPCTLKQIVRAISKGMGTRLTREVSAEEAFLYRDLTQSAFDRCTLNLRMEPGYIAEDMDIPWKSDLNFAENIKVLVREFRNARKLHPYRIVIHGVPGSGKTKLATMLCQYYGCHYISAKTVIEETIRNLNQKIESAELRLKIKQEKPTPESEYGEEEDDEEEPEEDETEELADWKEKVRDIEATLAMSENRKLPDDYLIRLIKGLITSNVCQNQGYVLDGYPKTLLQAKELFGQAAEGGGEEGGGEAEEDEEGGIVGNASKSLLPDCVISLSATDEFVCDRIMSLPEHLIQGTHYTEEGMLRRLAEFRENNTEDNTVLNFFNENEIHPLVIDIMSISEDAIFDKACQQVGPYIGFTLTPEEEMELKRLEAERLKLMMERDRLERAMRMENAEDEYYRKMQEWTETLERLQMEEEKVLAIQSEPLRNYLMKYVFPTLTKGLIEVATIKPSDPVDFLAEYLFKINPEGKMFDPSYTRDGENLIGDLEAHVEEILKDMKECQSKQQVDRLIK